MTSILSSYYYRQKIERNHWNITVSVYVEVHFTQHAKYQLLEFGFQAHIKWKASRARKLDENEVHNGDVWGSIGPFVDESVSILFARGSYLSS